MSTADSSYDLVVIGAGLSGLAAGLRAARFGLKVIILEKHVIAGGLNSYYQREGYKFESGLHAITNFAQPKDRRAPLNRLLRQLKISRDAFVPYEQKTSSILFNGVAEIAFTNDFTLMESQVEEAFPDCIDGFRQLVAMMNDFDPFAVKPYSSTRRVLAEYINDPILIDMLLCPTQFYGSAVEDDLDFDQFVIMFRSLFQEGMWRCEGGIRHVLDTIIAHYKEAGGEIRFRAPVTEFIKDGETLTGVKLKYGDEYHAKHVVSTIGTPYTQRLIEGSEPTAHLDKAGQLGFVESIHLMPRADANTLKRQDNTIIFYNNGSTFSYRCPTEDVDVNSAVICFADNFQGQPETDTFAVRLTHLANYDNWKAYDKKTYKAKKADYLAASEAHYGEIIGNYSQNAVYVDSFTPITVEKFTWKDKGAIYGSPQKSKDGHTDLKNCYIAGTDQGFLGIVGSMLSGVSMVNAHVLTNV